MRLETSNDSGVRSSGDRLHLSFPSPPSTLIGRFPVVNDHQLLIEFTLTRYNDAEEPFALDHRPALFLFGDYPRCHRQIVIGAAATPISHGHGAALQIGRKRGDDGGGHE